MQNNCWIQLHSGKRMFPLAPTPEMISIEDIAHALSNICRFAGHCREFYSVAQHSVMVSVHVSRKNLMWGLLHDAAEAYLCDIPTPIKKSGMIDGYADLEQSILQCVADRFGLEWPVPEEIRKVDTILLNTEARDLGLLSDIWNIDSGFLRNRIVPVDQKTAYRVFMDWFENNQPRAVA